MTGMSDSRQHELIALDLPDGGRLAGDLSYTGTPGPFAVVSVHGFGSHRRGEKSLALEAACARRGWTFAAFDFRGHGESSGTLLELRGSGLLADLAAVRNALAGRGIRRLGPVGSSMGGFATAWFARANADAVPACVLLAPAFHFLHRRFEELSPEEREAFRRAGKIRVRNEWVDAELSYAMFDERGRFRMAELAARWSLPLLIFHGMRDDVIPFGDSLEFTVRATGARIELRLFKDGDHRLTAFKDEIAEGACRFLEKYFGEPAAHAAGSPSSSGVTNSCSG
jgi:pimeloyl-ACP methyl ester carboxylesterase